MQAIHLVLTDSLGIYIPQQFIKGHDISQFGLVEDDWDVQTCKEGPDADGYWEAWDSILNKAEFHKDGHKYLLHQDGDLWLICYELMTNEERRNFGFEEMFEEEAA